jgi:ATP-binding cassette subfamily F protein 3
MSVIEYIEACAPTQLVPRLRNLLGAFLFQGDDIHKTVSVLSGGEKSRLQLLRLLLRPTNLLMLDEPTNHLDMTSKDVLLDALRNYSGTLVFVSHDRYFIEHLADRVLELDAGKAKLYVGDYSYYLWSKEKGSREPAAELIQFRSDLSEEPTDSKKQREMRKQIKSQLEKLQREERELVDRLEDLEEAKQRLAESMTDQQVYLNGEKMRQIKKKLEAYESEQRELTERWERVTGELEKTSEKAD